MREMDRIAEQLRRAFESNAWHGPALMETLSGVTAAEAQNRPVPTAHSIWEMVQHLSSWKEIVARRLAGERIDDVAADFDWPPVTDSSESGWQATLQHLSEAQRKLMDAVKVFDPMRLMSSVPGTNYTYFVMIYGSPQHDVYHAGQISLLKRATAEKERPVSN